MKVTDLNGYEIEITNLQEAIKVAKRNTGYHHEDKSFSEFDKRLLDRHTRETYRNQKTNR